MSDTLHKIVIVDGREIIPRRTFQYDTLVISVGSQSNDFGTSGADEHAFALDTTAQAERFHKRLINACIQANTQTAPLRPGQLKVVIIGAGATGVELAAELHKSTRELAAYGLDKIDPEKDIQLHIIEASDRILPALPERLSHATEVELRKLNVAIHTGQRVTQVDTDGVKTQDGQHFPAELVVWAAGIKAPPFLAKLEGLETNSLNQLLVGPTRISSPSATAPPAPGPGIRTTCRPAPRPPTSKRKRCSRPWSGASAGSRPWISATATSVRSSRSANTPPSAI